MSIRSLVLVFAIGVLLASCTASPDDDVCSDLKKGLAKCGLPASDLECARLDVSSREALVQRIDTMGCTGVARSATDDGAVDPRVCALGRFPCPESPTPAPNDAIPIYPLVFVSGIDSSDAFGWNPRIFEALHDRGIPYEHVKLASWATTDVRGAELWDAIKSVQRRFDAAKVNLVGYAVGGLDCRWVARDASRRESLASITTIATPHRGTRVADAALAALKSGATAEIVASLTGTSSSLPDNTTLTRALEGLTEASLASRSEVDEVPADVYVQSFAGVSHVLGRTSASAEARVHDACVDDDSGAFSFFRHEGNDDALSELLVVTAPFAGAPADGMVSVASSKWGVFRGCLPADHYDVIGQIGQVTRDPMTGWYAPRFYQWLASDLADRGY